MILSKAKYGDRRETTRFAWLPVDLSNGQVIWLRKYKCEEVLRHQLQFLGSGPEWVVANKWIEE